MLGFGVELSHNNETLHCNLGEWRYLFGVNIWCRDVFFWVFPDPIVALAETCSKLLDLGFLLFPRLNIARKKKVSTRPNTVEDVTYHRGLRHWHA